jgi:hypothetical protein
LVERSPEGGLRWVGRTHSSSGDDTRGERSLLCVDGAGQQERRDNQEQRGPHFREKRGLVETGGVRL